MIGFVGPRTARWVGGDDASNATPPTNDPQVLLPVAGPGGIGTSTSASTSPMQPTSDGLVWERVQPLPFRLKAIDQLRKPSQPLYILSDQATEDWRKHKNLVKRLGWASRTRLGRVPVDGGGSMQPAWLLLVVHAPP